MASTSDYYQSPH
jgi:hypothetical protein